MAADRLVYCLEQITDYDQFERLCSDLMSAEGHKGLEPLGGSKDKGRDALHVSDSSGKATIFAYSVREDWRDKLEEDAAKIAKHQHTCDRLAFLCTATFTATERDKAIEFIQKTYGWECELYGLERLRVMLATTHSKLVAQHPQIFVPPFFPTAGGLTTVEAFDHVLIDHVDSDSALAHWLSRRLTLSGYSVWCRGLTPLAGTSASETVRRLITSRAAHYLCILSPESVADPDFSSRRSFAQGTERIPAFFIPVLSKPVNVAGLDQEIRRLTVADFTSGWAQGLKSIEEVLEAAHCPRKAEGTRQLVLNSYLPSDLILNEPETLSSNLFAISSIPDAIHRFYSTSPLTDDHGPNVGQWAFRRVTDTHFLSFHKPPLELAREFGITAKGGSVWNGRKEIDGVDTSDLLKELIKKSLIAACRRRGLQFCLERKLLFFPSGLLKSEFLRFHDAEGNAKSFTVTGERTHGRGPKSSKYLYQVAPVFVPIGSPEEGFEVLLRIRVRLTDSKGVLFPGHSGNSRRKKLCKNWWNADWLTRTKGIMQFLADRAGEVRIGDTTADEIVIDAHPRTWLAPVRLNEDALGDKHAEIEEEFRSIFDHDEDEGDEIDG